jgi:LEA14-like dessication related protein
MKSLWLKVLPLLVCLLIASGCNSNTKLGDVLVDITGYQPVLGGNQAILTLRYTNENVFPIAIADTKGKLYLNGEYIGTVNQKTAVGIPQLNPATPQLNTATRQAELLIEHPEVLKIILAANSSSVTYRLESTLRIEASEDRIKIKTAYSGQLDATTLRAAPAPVPEPKG